MTHVGIGTGGNHLSGSNDNSCTLTLPAAAAVDDVAFAVVTNISSSTVNAAPSGWTLVQGPTTSSTTMTRYIYRKKLVAGDIAVVNGGSGTGNHTWGWTGAGRASGALEVRRDVDDTHIIIGAAQIVTALHGTDTAPVIATDVSNMDVMMFFSGRIPNTNPGPTLAVGGGFTKGQESTTNNTGGVANSTSTIGYLTTPGAAGNYGGQTVTYGGTGTNPSLLTMIAISPSTAIASAHFVKSGGVFVPVTTAIH